MIKWIKRKIWERRLIKVTKYIRKNFKEGLRYNPADDTFIFKWSNSIETEIKERKHKWLPW